MNENQQVIAFEGWEDLKPHDGAGYTRVAPGDYRFKIDEVAWKTKEGARPHTMIQVSLRVTGCLRGDKSAVGATLRSLYGGPASPEFMQRRSKTLFGAIGVTPPAPLAALEGREFDASVVWELSDPKTDPETGKDRVYVNDRVVCERRVGAQGRPGWDPIQASRAAQKHLGELSNGVERETMTIGAGGVGELDVGALPVAVPAVSGAWLPEAEVMKSAHEYRALIAMGVPAADAMRETLVAARINPDGPVNLDHVPATTRAQYLAFVARTPRGELPPPPTGELPPPPGGAGRPRTGTRTPRV